MGKEWTILTRIMKDDHEERTGGMNNEVCLGNE